MSNHNVLSRLIVYGEQSNHCKGYTLRPAWNDGGHRPSRRRQLPVARAGLHCEHDGEYRAPRVCNGPRIRTVHRTLVDSSHRFSSGGDTWRTGHGAGEYRFADSICGTSVPPGGCFSVCCVVLWHRIPTLSARKFFSTVCSDRLDGARDGHAECRCPETRNPGSDDNGPDINDHRHRRGLFARERQQPEVGEKGCVGRRNVFGCGVRCSRHTLLDLTGPVACDRNLRRVQCRVVSLCAHVRLTP
jgi:hypothetical protein